MVGTKAGGLKAAATNRKKYGDDFFRKIGSKGGQLGTTGGFYADRELAKAAGAKGGRISRRGSSGAVKEKEYVWRAGEPMWEVKDE